MLGFEIRSQRVSNYWVFIFFSVSAHAHSYIFILKDLLLEEIIPNSLNEPNLYFYNLRYLSFQITQMILFTCFAFEIFIGQ